MRPFTPHLRNAERHQLIGGGKNIAKTLTLIQSIGNCREAVGLQTPDESPSAGGALS